jgi:ethanolamine utilization protein EutA
MHDDDDDPMSPHDHDGFGFDPDTAVVEELEGLEMFRLRSVGIDIGSSTSHLIFSQLTLRREGSNLSAKFQVTDRQVLYRSDIMMTPYLTGTQIDTEKISHFIHNAYEQAGFTPENVDTGAVVITGEALKKENAQPIAELFQRESGKFICASAGPNHEALLAAYGCGAAAMSKDGKSNIINLDMGGGTAKFSIIQDGIVAQTAALEVGARLIAFDENNVVTRLEKPAIRLMKELGKTISLGQELADDDKRDFVDLMTKTLFEVLLGGSLSPLAKELLLTEPLQGYENLQGISHLVCSGGVSEYVYGYDDVARGDLGLLFGKRVREEIDKLGIEGLLQEPNEGIRATVIGAGEYTVQASGTTCYISNPNILPIFGYQVVRPILSDDISVEDALNQALTKFDLSELTTGVALAISPKGNQDYQSLKQLADGITAVIRGSKNPGNTLFLLLDMDVAKSLGGVLKEEIRIPQDVIAVDGIDVGDLDYVDIGRPMGVSEVMPVTVKSLLFPSSQ